MLREVARIAVWMSWRGVTACLGGGYGYASARGYGYASARRDGYASARGYGYASARGAIAMPVELYR